MIISNSPIKRFPAGTVHILCVLPNESFDPSEVAIPWSVLTSLGGARFTFAVADPTKPARADPMMVTGEGLYLMKWSMRAAENARVAYDAMIKSKSLDPPNTISYQQALDAIQQAPQEGAAAAAAASSSSPETDSTTQQQPQQLNFTALLLPGGHKADGETSPNTGMRAFLEDQTAQRLVAQFAQLKPTAPIAAVCHGVVLASRSGILKGKRITALESWQEGLAHNLTRAWLGSYYKTYTDRTVESEIREKSGCKEFVGGSKLTSLGRDTLEKPNGHTVRDGNLVTARWPGDCFALSVVFTQIISEQLAA